jgi:predicted enzyme related to lactoylglutathione lyase
MATMQTDTTQNSPILGIDATTYLVKDVERAKKFYRDVMGFPLTTEFGDQGCEFVFPDNTTFGLWKMDDGSWSAGSGVLFSVGDFDAAIDRLKRAGVKIAPHMEDTPGCKMAFAEDSEGNSFILHFRKDGRD